jgi:pyruvate formate lyase activating enzyme
MKEASYYSKLDDNRVECGLCPHHCKIPSGRRGLCLTRENIDGVLIAANYCKPVSTAIDPIEKKPLYHYYPGSSIFSTGPAGCTFKCDFCQNFGISQVALNVQEIGVKRLLAMVLESNTIGIAYTYSEPTIWFETIMELGTLVHAHGLKNVMVTNGYIEPGPLKELLTVVDAMNIDIKSMNESFYRRLCKGSLPEVLRTCETAKNAGCHVEITNLLIPGENDSPEETIRLADFIATHLGKETPLHLSRYFPRYRLNQPPTPSSLLERAWEIARQRLDYVYIGNCASTNKENTLCPKCGTALVFRCGYETTLSADLSTDTGAFPKKPFCAKCNYTIDMVL